LEDKYIKISLVIIAVLAIVSGSSLLVVSYLPFKLVKAEIDTLAIDKNVEIFTAELFKEITVKIRFIGFILIFISVLGYKFNRHILQYLSSIKTSFLAFLRELAYQGREAIQREDKIHIYAFFIILTAAVCVRVISLFKPITHDEALTFFRFASKPLYVGLTYYPEANNHFFHTFLVHIVYLVLGMEPWMIRLPALLAGILLIPASYLATRIVYNKSAALLASSLIAISPMIINYSTLARGHIIICLIFMIILALAVYLKQNRNPSAWFIFAVLSAIGFYTIPIMIYPFGVVITWLFLSAIFKDTITGCKHFLIDLFIMLIIMALLVFTLYMPVFAVTGFKAYVTNPWLMPDPWARFIADFLPFLKFEWGIWNKGIPTAIRFLLVAGFLISLVFHKRLSIHRIPIFLAVVLWCTPVILIQRDIFYPRLWLFLLLFYIMLASSGISYLLRLIESTFGRHKAVVSALLAVALVVWSGLDIVRAKTVSERNECRSKAECITIFLEESLRSGDRVIITSTDLYDLLEYYFMLHDIPAEYFVTNFDATHRIIVIVDEGYFGETIEKVLDLYVKRHCELNKDCLAPFSAPKLIQKYNVVNLYEMNRLNDG
jgi:4-amino-4-deoxy-L-arabinose transferase-like glycosyltransferase